MFEKLKKYGQPVAVAIIAQVIGFLFLFLVSPEDVRGAMSDAFLKLQVFTFKVTLFSIGLMIWFHYLDFRETFHEAAASVAHSQKAIAVAIMVCAWALVVFSF